MAIHDRKIEYRVKPVTRYIVTRCELGEYANSVSQVGGEYDTAEVAYQVGYAVCRIEHEKLGWPMDDDRMQYPRDIAEIASPIDAATIPRKC